MGEAVGRNHIVLAVLDRDAGAVAVEVVRVDARREAVAAPHAVFAPPQAVAGDGVAAEGRLDAVGGGVADVVAGKDVVVGAAAAGVHRGLAGPEEHAVAAVGERVVGDDVAAALLVDQQSRRVLAARVHAVAVAADVVVHAIVEDGVVAGSIQADPQAGIEREIVVPNREPATADQQQCVHALHHRVLAHLSARDIRQVDRGAEPQPFVVIVVVKRQPVDETLVLHETEEPGLPVVAQVVADQGQIVRAAGQDPDFISSHSRVEYPDVPSAGDDDRRIAGQIGIRLRCHSLQRRAAKIDRDTVALHRDRA